MQITKLNKAQILTVIAGINIKQDDINDSIQNVLVNSTAHALGVGNGDVSTFETLLNSIKGVDRKAVMTWCKQFAPVNFAKNGKATCNKSKFKELRAGETSFEQIAKYEHWVTFVPTVAQVAQSYDLLARTESIIKKNEEHDAGVTIKNGDFASYLKDAVAKFKAAQAETASA